MIYPKVSILVPVYNRVDMIKDCVDSALSQDYLDLEVIVSDNCSTDGTWELCWRLYSDHPKVKLCRNASNVGPVLNWLCAARAATGQYVKILFSDDLLLEGCIRKLVAQQFRYCLLSCDWSKLEALSLHMLAEDLRKALFVMSLHPRGDRYALFAGSRIPVSPMQL